MKYCNNEDINIAIQILKVVVNKQTGRKIERIIRPPLNRVIMELEDMIKNE